MRENIWNIILINTLIGCGGGGDGAESKTPPPVSITPPAETSYLLTDNPVSESAQFSQYISHSIAILPEDYGFSSSEVYLKIYTLDQKVLFLGKVASMKAFSLHLPSSVDRVYFDLFSPVTTEEQFTGEIIL
ncbi:hypothetical protein KO527_00995 [Pseudoalteromonas sp. C2R02]|uniref:hypothetical protein n=1 Tax=Pseudoalteromonas sp. C2R02 TaxID=2841565 RepID=UPI001C087E98|nr:hypothetical protein [Pseudoalteromonas sp. C2R02]MBU2967940.1 hypothetical protein [Pseudoalteromonas sp. C2R02]